MARLFNSSTDAITAGSAPYGGQPVTLACWVKATTTSGTKWALGEWASGNPSKVMIMRAAGQWQGQVFNSAGNSRTLTHATGLTTGRWYHLCLRSQSSTATQFWVDGALSVSGLGRGLTSVDRLAIGNDDTAAAAFDGHIAEAAIWAADLLDAEVVSLARGFSPRQVRPAALSFYAPLVRNILDARAGLALSTTGTSVSDHSRIAA